MEKIYELAKSILDHVDALATGEHAESLKSKLSALVHEAQSISNAHALALASAPKSAATSPAPTPPEAAAAKPAPAPAAVFVHPLYGEQKK
jgi:hypothetical protein